jgi:hypothetical protein
MLLHRSHRIISTQVPLFIIRRYRGFISLFLTASCSAGHRLHPVSPPETTRHDQPSQKDPVMQEAERMTLGLGSRGGFVKKREL